MNYFKSDHFKNKSIDELVEILNGQVGINAWGSARAEFLHLLQEELIYRGIDITDLTDGASFKLRKVKLIEDKSRLLLIDPSEKEFKQPLKIKPSNLDLIFYVWTDINGIILEREKYLELQLMEFALENSKTWKDFKELLPSSTFSELGMWIDNGGDFVYKDEDGIYLGDDFSSRGFNSVDEVTDVINDTDLFDPEKLYEFPEYFPPWIQSVSDELLPDGFVEKYGEEGNIAMAGYWFEYPYDLYEKMKEDLLQHGHKIEIVKM